MDAVDGLVVSDTESQIITRSSLHTPEGAAAGVIAICLTWLPLTQLTEPTRTQWLVCAPILSRAAIILGYRFLPANPDVGPVTRSLAGSARGLGAAASIVIAVIACLALTGVHASVVIVVAAASAIGAATLFRCHAGALGGDHFGALGVVAETSILTGAAIVGHLI
jgi:cobalamin synthase